MDTSTDTPTVSRLSSRRAEEREFRWAIWIGTALALPVVVAQRLMPQPRQASPFISAPRRSVLADARAIANTVIPFAFMR